MALDRELSKRKYKALINIYVFFNMLNINTNKTTLGFHLTPAKVRKERNTAVDSSKEKPLHFQ